MREVWGRICPTSTACQGRSGGEAAEWLTRLSGWGHRAVTPPREGTGPQKGSKTPGCPNTAMLHPQYPQQHPWSPKAGLSHMGGELALFHRGGGQSQPSPGRGTAVEHPRKDPGSSASSTPCRQGAPGAARSPSRVSREVCAPRSGSAGAGLLTGAFPHPYPSLVQACGGTAASPRRLVVPRQAS